MTEREWLECAEPLHLLQFLQGKATPRQLRLLLCGWSRLHWRWLPAHCRAGVEQGERYADGLITEEDRGLAAAELWQATSGRHNPIRNWLTRLTLDGDIDLMPAAAFSTSANPKLKKKQEALVRCIFGNPFGRAARNPVWLTWNGGTIPKVAQAIYEESAFDRMPILADALEDAGCGDAAILNHCRSPGVHVRGCWLVDHLTGRE